MATRKGNRPQRRTSKKGELTVVHSNAAGIDIGSEHHYVAVREDASEQSIRAFGCFTADLYELVHWLEECGVTTVAMESTGVYWIPLFQVLERSGFEVNLVNARHAKNVPGRTKSDVLDCRWLQRLHTYGLLAASFRPSDQICVLRSYLRHRETLVEGSTQHVQRMQKALTQMNVQLHKVVADITGVTGLRIIDAILAGERDRPKLAALRDGRARRNSEAFVKALEGDYREEHLFALRHELELYRVLQKKIAECEAAIAGELRSFSERVDVQDQPLAPSKDRRHPDLREQLYRVSGVDFTRIPGIQALNALIITSEVGLDMSKWPTVKHFASWLRLSPGNDVTGGKVIRRRTKPGPNRASNAFRMAAQSVGRTQTALGAFYRRKKAALGAPKAITATAHKIARIYYRLASTGHEYVDPGLEEYERRYEHRVLKNLKRRAAKLGYELVENAPTT